MNDETEKRPFLSSFKDRHGTICWRFRRSGKTVSIPGEPGDPEFEERYLAAVEGRKPRVATIQKLPSAALPGSFRQAWLKVKRTPEWIAHDPATKDKNERLAKVFLNLNVVDGHPAQWGDMPVRDLR
ncbi:hypothetical protein KHC17_18725 [Agrobacterium salinitolerans]|uniref:hypothetical protein n=1 Tax=Agrobacterium salinitolerans TaxID=1183413 RepID=UPI001C2461A8|nr:hypothetical protein [Agrobacterium salinitolerans]QXC49887.1 hypothetical protein KHC17_18725 [Agrobacterium salinitolerans]